MLRTFDMLSRKSINQDASNKQGSFKGLIVGWMVQENENYFSSQSWMTYKGLTQWLKHESLKLSIFLFSMVSVEWAPELALLHVSEWSRYILSNPTYLKSDCIPSVWMWKFQNLWSVNAVQDGYIASALICQNPLNL